MTSYNGIKVRDTILWCEDSGEDNLPTLLCLHSLFLDGRMFDELATAAKGRMRVVCPDFRGQGRSAPALKAIVTMDECADDMLALIDQLGLHEVHVLGASMGGDVAIRMAARKPALFKSLVLMGSSARGEPDVQKSAFNDFVASLEVTGFCGDNLEMLLGIMFADSVRKDPASTERLAYWEGSMHRLSRALWPAMFGVIERESAVPLLDGITARTLIFSGAQDVARPPEWSREVRDGIPGAELIFLEGGGHSPIIEVPDQVIERTIAFALKNTSVEA